MRPLLLPDSVLDGQTLGRLDRWRKARALFLRADGPEAERAVSQAIGKAWAHAQVYGRARRLLIERKVETLLSQLESRLGPLAEKVRVAPEDPRQTKWDAIGNLTPLPAAGPGARALVDRRAQVRRSLRRVPADLRSADRRGLRLRGLSCARACRTGAAGRPRTSSRRRAPCASSGRSSVSPGRGPSKRRRACRPIRCSS